MNKAKVIVICHLPQECGSSVADFIDLSTGLVICNINLDGYYNYMTSKESEETVVKTEKYSTLSKKSELYKHANGYTYTDNACWNKNIVVKVLKSEHKDLGNDFYSVVDTLEKTITSKVYQDVYVPENDTLAIMLKEQFNIVFTEEDHKNYSIYDIMHKVADVKGYDIVKIYTYA